MGPATIDAEYGKLQEEVQQVGQAINSLAQKLQAAANSGDANAMQWLSDLRTIAMEVQDEQAQVESLLQAMHGFTVASLQEHVQTQGLMQQGYGQQGFAPPGPGAAYPQQAGQGYDPMQPGYDPMQPGYDPMQQGYDPMQQGYDPMQGMMAGGAMGGAMMGGPQATLERFLGGSFSRGMGRPHEGFIERHITRDIL